MCSSYFPFKKRPVLSHQMHRYGYPAIITICVSQKITSHLMSRPCVERDERVLSHMDSPSFLDRSRGESRTDDAHGETYAKPFTIAPSRHYAIINRVAATDNLHLRGGRKALLRITTRRARRRITYSERKRGSLYTVASLSDPTSSLASYFLR